MSTVHVSINSTHTTTYDWDQTMKDLGEIFRDINKDVAKLTKRSQPVHIDIQIEP